MLGAQCQRDRPTIRLSEAEAQKNWTERSPHSLRSSLCYSCTQAGARAHPRTHSALLKSERNFPLSSEQKNNDRSVAPRRLLAHSRRAWLDGPQVELRDSSTKLCLQRPAVHLLSHKVNTARSTPTQSVFPLMSLTIKIVGPIDSGWNQVSLGQL